MSENEEMNEEQIKEAEEKAIAEIAAQYTKEELVKRVFTSKGIVDEIIKLLRILSVDRNELTPVQQTVYDSAHARKLREGARAMSKVVLSKYEGNRATVALDAPEAETDGEG